MYGFKKIEFSVADGNGVMVYEYKNVSLEDAIKILKDPNVIGFKATRMTTGEYLKSQQTKWEVKA